MSRSEIATVPQFASFAGTRAAAIALLLSVFSSTAWGLICNSNGTAPQNWNNNATWSCAATPGAADDVTINAGHNISLNGAGRQSRNFTIAAGGQLTTGGAGLTIQNNGVVQIDGVLQGNGAAASLLTKNGTGGLSGTGSLNNLQQVTINNNTTIATGTNLTFTGAECRLSIGAGDTVINDGTVTFNTAACGTANSLTLSGTSVWTNNGTVTVGTVTGASGAVWTNAADSTLNVGAAMLTTGGTVLNASASNNTVNYRGAAQIVKVPSGNDYFHLTLSGSSNKDPVTASTYDILGNFTVNAGVTWRGSNPANDPAVNITGNLTNDGTFITGDDAYTLGGNFTNNGTFTHTAAGTLTMNGTAAQAIGGTTTTTFLTLTVTNTSAAVSANTNFNVTTTLNMNGANTLLTPAASVVVGGAGNLTGTGTVQVTRIAATADFASQYTITTKTLTNLTVEYIGAATQAVNALTYGSAGPNGGLRISNTSAAVTAAANFTVNGTLTMNGAATVLTPAAAVVVSGAGTMTGTGTVQVTRTAPTAGFSQQYTMTTNTLTNLTVEYIGAAAQVVSALTYGGLKINNGSGVTLAGNAAAGTLLTLESGVVTTGASTLISSASCPAGVSRTSGHVAGNLRLSVPGGGASPTCVWPIGDASGYRPVTVAFNNVGTAGTVDAAISQAAGEHPNIGTSAFDSALDVNRYWTLTNATTAFTSAIATFTWLVGDVDGGADPLVFVTGRFSGGWSYPTTLPAALSAQATGLDGATLTGVFAAGEIGLFSHWRMDQNLWNGTANEVVDSGTGANHGTASTCAFVGCAGGGSAPPVPTTSSVSPAVGVGGVSGTCSYGVFNRANKDYVALPGGYPALMNAAGGFTITAWIYTTNNMLNGQRIMIHDQNDTSPGSWGFSVGETTVNGGLRFYYRQGAVFMLDTPAIPSNQWLFVAVSVRLAAGANASSASSYVYDTSGALVTSAGPTAFTWTAGAAAGPPSLGGETNASTEGNANFGFSGRIDEVRVYRAPLGSTQIDQIRLASRTCATFNHLRIEHDGAGLTCAPETMTVRACFDAACTQNYNGTVTTTLSPTGWVGGDTVAVTGSLTPQLRRTTAGSVTLGAGAATPAPTGATRCFVGLAETCSFEFRDSGFLFDVPNLTSCKPSGNVTITAVRADLTSETCVPAFESGTRSVNFWSTYSSPATGSGLVEINGTPVATAPAGTGINLTFTTGATSTFTVRYPDAGQMQLNARYTGSGAEAGLIMDGSDTFVAAPVGLAVVPTGGACVAGDASCAVYRKAGESFNHAVRAACWTVDGDTDLTDNPLTPNFDMAAIPLSSTLVAPSGGVNASLGASTVTFVGGTGGDGGTKTVAQTVSEVGVFTITATPVAASYFGLTVPGGTSPNIGRFTPNHLTYTTNTPSFAAGCVAGSFSYVGQAFNFGVGAAPVMTVTARNLAGATTTNYQGGFFKLTNSSLSGRSYTAATGTLDTGGLPLTTVDPVIVDNSNGTASLTFSAGAGISFSRTTPVAPFDAEISLAINLIDGDGVVHESPVGTPANPARFGQATAGNGIAFTGGKEMRFGRLRLSNASGSLFVPLTVPARTEYWNGTGFVLNVADSCTTLDRENVAMINYATARNLEACETMVNQGSPATSTVTFAGGNGTIRLRAPGTGNEGSVTLVPQLGASASGNYCAASPGAESAATAAIKSYLQGAWTGGVVYDQNPSARAAFGIFGAQPRQFIFYRENY